MALFGVSQVQSTPNGRQSSQGSARGFNFLVSILNYAFVCVYTLHGSLVEQNAGSSFIYTV